MKTVTNVNKVVVENETKKYLENKFSCIKISFTKENEEN